MNNLLLAFTPLSFLRIKSDDIFVYQWLAPIILTLCSLTAYWFLPCPPTLRGDEGLISNVSSLLSTLIGFYIAALAAVASFENKNLDNTMKGTPPILIKRKKDDSIETEKLTRRRFLCSLFGYCSFISIFLFFWGMLGRTLSPSLQDIEPLLFFSLKFSWLLIFSFFSSSLLMTTLLGLHYLVDRMHRE